MKRRFEGVGRVSMPDATNRQDWNPDLYIGDPCFLLTTVTQGVTLLQMIETFSHRGLEDSFYDGVKKRIQPKHAQKAGDILDLLNAANRG